MPTTWSCPRRCASTCAPRTLAAPGRSACAVARSPFRGPACSTDGAAPPTGCAPAGSRRRTAGPGRSGGPLRRGRRGGHQGRHRGRHRCLLAPGALRAGCGVSLGDRPTDDRPTRPGRWSGPVHRPPRPRVLRPARRGRRLGGGASRRGPVGGEPRASSRDVRAHPGPAVRGGDGHDPGRVGVPAAPGPDSRTAGTDGPRGRRGRQTGRIQHGAGPEAPRRHHARDEPAMRLDAGATASE